MASARCCRPAVAEELIKYTMRIAPSDGLVDITGTGAAPFFGDDWQSKYPTCPSQIRAAAALEFARRSQPSGGKAIGGGDSEAVQQSATSFKFNTCPGWVAFGGAWGLVQLAARGTNGEACCGTLQTQRGPVVVSVRGSACPAILHSTAPYDQITNQVTHAMGAYAQQAGDNAAAAYDGADEEGYADARFLAEADAERGLRSGALVVTITAAQTAGGEDCAVAFADRVEHQPRRAEPLLDRLQARSRYILGDACQVTDC